MTVPILQADDITLRPLVLHDAGAITSAMSDWNVVQWLSAVPFPYSHADAVYFITEIAPNDTIWAIEGGAGLIGVVGVKPDLGYWLTADYHGQGIMTRAARAAVGWYFDQTDQPLVSGHFPDNIGSRTVLRKLGFQDTDLGSVYQVSQGRDVPLQKMILTQENWLSNDV